MSQSSMPGIPDQVKLPFRVAFDVVLQGIRIRFGRSLVTLTGVVLGIAFLMSVFSGQVLKGGVANEDQKRAEVTRMYNFLVAEMGPPMGRQIAILGQGPLNESETRLLRRLEERELAGAQTVQRMQSELAGVFRDLKPQVVSGERIPNPIAALLVVGNPSHDEKLPAGIDSKTIVAYTRVRDVHPSQDGLRTVQLAREVPPEERARLQAERQRARFRNIWVMIVALLVTVMGITNAMLMSVTERFREIGTMKCLGALSRFVRRLFLIESVLIGILGGMAGCLIGFLFSLAAYSLTYGTAITLAALHAGSTRLLLYVALSIVAGLALSAAAAIYPATVAARMVPADALRSNV